MNIEFKMVKTN